jgi:hypothetical protein
MLRGFCYLRILQRNGPMKTIFSIALLAAVISLSNLACKKLDQPSLASDSNTSPSAAGKTTANSETAQPASVDKDKLLSELTTIAREYNSANDKGDPAALERLLANDFTARWQGKVYDKNGWTEGKKPSEVIATDEIINPTLVGNTADMVTIHFDRRFTYNNGNSPFTERDSLAFVKRDGRWQIKEHISGH